MKFEGLHNQKVCAGEHQPQVTLAQNRKNCKNQNIPSKYLPPQSQQSKL